VINIYSNEEIKFFLNKFLKHGLVVSPWLAGVHSEGRFDTAIYHLLDSAAIDISAKLWTDDVKIKVYDALPIPERIAHTAVYEVSASTAVSLAYDLTGTNEVNENIAYLTVEKINEYIENYGFGSLVAIYGNIASYENHHAVAYYGRIAERDFVMGSLHRPWVDYALSDELLFGLYLGNYRLVVIDEIRYVELTPTGYETMRNTEHLLAQSGYLAKKMIQLQISNFNFLDKYDENAMAICPNVNLLRTSFINWAHIAPGMRVLELGCADGVLAFDGGLAERIGKKGLLVGIDSSPAMIARAEDKLSLQPMNWVRFYRTRAEDMPFLDQSFDAVIGIDVWKHLQFPDALQEIFRVLKPGGFFASFHPTGSAFSNIRFFREWFEPLLQQAHARNQEDMLDYLPAFEQAHRQLEQIGFAEIVSDRRELANHFVSADLVIDHLILGVGWFQEELSLLPWKAREEMIAELRVRGASVCKRYSDSERLINVNIQFIRGYKRM
jgi:ubiquinone/menaquinone biosynthesis C-methylase UbiE